MWGFPVPPDPKDLDSQTDARPLYEYLTYTPDSLELETSEIQKISLDGKDYLICVRRMDGSINMRAQYLIAYNPLYDTAQLLSSMGGLVFMITAALAGLSLMVVWWIAGSIAKPIKQLCGDAIQIGQGIFHPVKAESKLREINELANAMSTMSNQLEHAEDMQKAFLQNASHELRTPLMSISGYAQGIQCGVFEDTTEPVNAILSESKRLTELVGELLSLSRIDSEKEIRELRTLNLTEVIDGCLEQLGGYALECGVKLCFSQEKDVLIQADEKLFAQALTNLLSNAVRFAKARVCVTVSERNNRVVVTVKDDGLGISSEDLPHLFERFYKGKGGNYGLGLSIAKASIEYMGGTIHVGDCDVGAAFELILNGKDLPK